MNEFPSEIIVSISDYLDELFIHRTFPLINRTWLKVYPKCVRTLRLELTTKWEKRLENNRSISLSNNMKQRLNIFLRDCNRVFHVDLSYVHVKNQHLIQVLTSYSHSLSSISIPGNNLVGANFIKRLGKKCKNLKRLDVSYCHKLVRPFASLLKEFLDDLELIVCNGLTSVTWEVIFEYSKSHPKTFVCAMHLLKKSDDPKFIPCYTKLHDEISSDVALAYYDFALVYGYEKCLQVLFDFYREEFPSLEAIFRSIKSGQRGALKFLARNGFPFKDEIPVSLIVETMDSGHIQVLDVLRYMKVLEFYMNEIDIKVVEKWIEKGRFDCLTQLRLGKFQHWNNVSLGSVHQSVLFGRLKVLNTLKEIRYSKFEDISPEIVKRGILNGHSKFINALSVDIIERIKVDDSLPKDVIKKIKHIIQDNKKKRTGN